LRNSDHTIIRGNLSQLTNLGILLIGSDSNSLRGNGAAPSFSDGNSCSGIVLVDSDDNNVAGNAASQNRSGFAGGGDGISVARAAAERR
jgi:parallel beta-helix repeat protein